LACFFYETLFHEQLLPQPLRRTQSQLADIFTLDRLPA
jgi:hypothetical protein